jgi:exonuclease SbcC
MMYREFNGFEQYVADRLTPQLSDYTSELLSAITEEKYDHVWFNSNYGIEVYDGADEKFDIAEFSGGERDVIALCARLALSRLIGGQANNPPGFLVLDEVFGSLDDVRRQNVIALLRGLQDRFEQVIVITHIEGVRDGLDRVLSIGFDERTGAAVVTRQDAGAADAALAGVESAA